VSDSESVAPGFGALDPGLAALETARIVMVPVPYDRTCSYQHGTARGPEAIIEASRHMEIWDDELGLDASTIGIHTADPVSGNDDPPEVMAGKVRSCWGASTASRSAPSRRTKRSTRGCPSCSSTRTAI
jgi:hypothetical protein